MALLDLFGLGQKKEDEPSLEDAEQILAYLEDLISPSAPPIQLCFAKQEDLEPLEVRIDGVFEAKHTFKIVTNRRLPKSVSSKVPFQLFFMIAGHRLRSAPIFLQKVLREAHYIFSLPKRVYHAERRARQRVTIGLRDGVQAIVLENFNKGSGAIGRVIDVSPRGFGIRVDKAMDIATQKPFPPIANLFESGQRLMMIRVKNFGLRSEFEFSAEVAHFSYRSASYCLGLKVTSIDVEARQALEEFVEKKIGSEEKAFPLIPRIKTRKKKDTRSEPKMALKTGEKVKTPGAEGHQGTAPASPKPSQAAKSSKKILKLKTLPSKEGALCLVLLGADHDYRQVLYYSLKAEPYQVLCFPDPAAFEEAKFDRDVHMVLAFPPPGATVDFEWAKRVRLTEGLEDAHLILLVKQTDTRSKIAAKSHGVQHVISFANDNFDEQVKAIIGRALKSQ